MSCVAAAAVVDVMREEKILDNVQIRYAHHALFTNYPTVAYPTMDLTHQLR